MRNQEMGVIDKGNFQENIELFIKLGDAITDDSLEQMEQKVSDMEAIFNQYAGEWEIMKQFPIEKMADGMCILGQKYYMIEQYWGALFWCKQARLYYGMAHGEESLSAAECNVWLGRICYELGNYTESLKWCIDALLMKENLQNSGFRENMQIYFIIARSYIMKEFYMAAEELLKKIYDNTEDKNFQAEIFRNMGILCDRQGNNRNALNWFVKAAKIKEQLFGQDSLEAAGLYNSIGIIYCNINKYTEAEEYLMRSLAVKEEQLPSNSISLSNTYHQLGNLEACREQITKALEWHQKSLDIRLLALDAGHPLIADSYLSVGGVYFRAGEYMKALDYNKKALVIYIQSLGKDHKLTRAVMQNIKELEKQINIDEGE